ncbi:MAG: mannose-1-phosphate guanylyltransferase [Muribaculaceae bacterium]|nr:mannose-1-phosphate guanylyltransferase [Muribaculaceae bacterium]
MTMDRRTHRYCVIMCGGIGSRFWPYSRARLPKQFIDFLGTGRTLLQMSYDRIAGIIPAENIVIMTNDRYAELVREQLPEVAEANILLEPARRNTAPCIAWAAWHIAARDSEASMIVTPADHVITREAEFERSILDGFDFVERHDALLTLGISPTRPETGYGYIQVGEPVEGAISKVKTFTEKPDYDLAKVFVDSGEFFWNSGIFLWRASAIREALRKYVPDIASAFDAAAPATYTDHAAETAFIASAFAGCMSISIDYSVMERADNVYVETVTFGWNDLGTWSALYDLSPKNSERNVTQNCRVLAYNCSGNIFAVRGNKLIVADGLEDYIIADADGVLLICPKAREQKIKQMVTDAKVKFGDEFE